MSLHPDYTGKYKYKWTELPPLMLSGLEPFMVTADTISFFKDDYKVPVISPEIAANLATYSELLFPILLVLGLLTRPAALALFILNAVALYSLYTAGWAQPIHNWIHAFYGAFLLMIFVYGPSKLSIDSWISDKLRGRASNLLLKVLGIIVLSGIAYFLLNKYS